LKLVYLEGFCQADPISPKQCSENGLYVVVVVRAI